MRNSLDLMFISLPPLLWPGPVKLGPSAICTYNFNALHAMLLLAQHVQIVALYILAQASQPNNCGCYERP